MKLLVVIDMQNDFIDGSLGSDAAQAIVPNVIEKSNLLIKTRQFYSQKILIMTIMLKLLRGENFLFSIVSLVLSAG